MSGYGRVPMRRIVIIGLLVLAACGGAEATSDPSPTTEHITRHDELNLPLGTNYTEFMQDLAIGHGHLYAQNVYANAYLDGIRIAEEERQAALAAQRSSGAGWCNEAGIIARESGGDPTVYNTSGSGASGLYQFMPGTWDGYGGYENAADAPPEVQQQKFNEVWAGGAGSSHWSC